ncbi:MAG: cupin domain-containing protein [bacterium]|nr:cupin domain-containing protein [bacterium]
MDKVNIADKLAQFNNHWSPHIVGEINNFHVKLAKLQGEFMWHHHEHEDEMFLVVKGQLLMKFRDRDVYINEGEFIIVPHGVEHLPVAQEEVHIMLIEPAETLNTGNLENERTVRDLKRV